ncbi:MAG: hypothetical protein ACMUIS_06075 [bacterium]
MRFAIPVITMIYGAFLALQPKRAINLQITLNRYINWHMEPVSMRREIIKTHITGGIVALCGILSLLLIIVQGL